MDALAERLAAAIFHEPVACYGLFVGSQFGLSHRLKMALKNEFESKIGL